MRDGVKQPTADRVGRSARQLGGAAAPYAAAAGAAAGGRLGGAWSGLFRGAAAKSSARAPFCHHKQRAVSYETKDKKSGSSFPPLCLCVFLVFFRECFSHFRSSFGAENFGKRIWMCDHSKHPSGDWRSNPYPDNEARCPFFEWDKQYRGFVAK